MQTVYAVFRTSIGARRAYSRLRGQLGPDARVALIEQPEALSHHVVPIQMTEARRGALIGALAVAGTIALILSLAGLLGAGPELAPARTSLLSVALGALLGGLAGALAFSSDSKARLRRLREHLRVKRPILIVSGGLGLERQLERFEPMRVGVLS